MAAQAAFLLDGAPGRRRPRARRWPAARGARHLLRRLGLTLGGAGLAGLGLAVALALLSYEPADPSFNSATARAPVNWLGAPGAHLSDLLLQLFGGAAALPPLLLLVWGARVALSQSQPAFAREGLWLGLAMIVGAAGLGLVWPGPLGPIATGAGGLLGLVAAKAFAALPPVAGLEAGLSALGAGIAALILALLLLARALAGGLRASGAAAAALWTWLRARAPHDRRDRDAAATAEPMPEPPPPARDPPRPQLSRSRETTPARGRERDRQPALALGDRADLPPLSLLAPPRGG
ncbi:DNA translocase FtsK 4TM domain-containing protein, partial [Thermaurantiacus sp.]